jgi:hypothetical protein
MVLVLELELLGLDLVLLDLQPLLLLAAELVLLGVRLLVVELVGLRHLLLIFLDKRQVLLGICLIPL